MSLLSQALSSALWRTRWRKLWRRERRASWRPRTTGFGRVGREANLDEAAADEHEGLPGGGWIGDDCVWRWGRALRSMGDRGDEARMGDEDSGEGTAGR